MAGKYSKKQICFAAAVVLFGCGGLYVFALDAAEAWRSTNPLRAEIDNFTSEFVPAADIAAGFADAVGFVNPFGSDDGSFQTLSKADDAGTVMQTIGGSTLLIDLDSVSGDEKEGTKVRLIGVKTPDKAVPPDYSSEQSNSMTVADLVSYKVPAGTSVLLEYDPKRKEESGCVLAYVYLSSGTMVQDWLLLNGYADISDDLAGTKYEAHFRELAGRAADNSAGLWNGYFKKKKASKGE